jgi:SAM-dependent methyltransferase
MIPPKTTQTLRLTRGNTNSFFNDVSIRAFLEKNLEKLHGDVLDIGSGRMPYKTTILSGQQVKKYIALDLEPGKFGYHSKADVYWDGITIPLPEHSVDSAILFEVLEHCQNPHIVINEAFRVLKPGGVLLFSTPFLYQLHGVPHDYQRLTPWGTQSLLETAGFIETKISPSGSWDASLGQMLGIWITKRPMPRIIRSLLKILFVPIFKTLLFFDKKMLKEECAENDIMPGILGITYKPS